MLAVGGRHFGMRGMKLVRRSDVDDIDIAIAAQRGGVFIDLACEILGKARAGSR